jgi:dolichol-phosphate mannosyltransferase
MNKERILAFAPMYNCEQQIPRVIKKFDSKVLPHFSELIIVDNGSQDNSIKNAITACEKLQPKIKCKVFKNRDNLGLGGSHKVAFNYAIDQGFDYLVVIHGDDQGNVQELCEIMESGTYKNYDSLLGARFLKDSNLIGYEKLRILGNITLNKLCSVLIKYPVYDLGSGLNMYDVNFLKSRFYHNFPNSLVFNVSMLFYSIHVKSKFLLFPITWEESDQISNANIFKVGATILNSAIQYWRNPELFFAANWIPDRTYGYDIVYQSRS